MFRSYETGMDDKIVLIMDVIPAEEPSAGPNYYNFDPTVLYTFNIDNDKDGRADDIRFEFQFKTEIAALSISSIYSSPMSRCRRSPHSTEQARKVSVCARPIR